MVPATRDNRVLASSIGVSGSSQLPARSVSVQTSRWGKTGLSEMNEELHTGVGLWITDHTPRDSYWEEAECLYLPQTWHVGVHM